MIGKLCTGQLQTVIIWGIYTEYRISTNRDDMGTLYSITINRNDMVTLYRITTNRGDMGTLDEIVHRWKEHFEETLNI